MIYVICFTVTNIVRRIDCLLLLVSAVFLRPSARELLHIDLPSFVGLATTLTIVTTSVSTVRLFVVFREINSSKHCAFNA